MLDPIRARSIGRQQRIWIDCASISVDAVVQMRRRGPGIAGIAHMAQECPGLNALAGARAGKPVQVRIVMMLAAWPIHPHHFPPQTIFPAAKHNSFG